MSDAISTEIAAIRDVMRTEPDRYWRDAGMQGRLLALHEAKGAAPVQGPRDDADGGGVARMPTLSAWLKAGNAAKDYDAHCQLVRTVNDVLVTLPAETRATLNASFDRLPHKAQMAALGALVDRRGTGASPLPEAAMRRLSSVPAYAKLAREWGGDAPRRFAVLRARMWRVVLRLDDAGVKATLDWLDNLPTAALVAVGRVLAR